MGSVSNRPFAVVTGGSSGIGFELAREFVEHGHDILIAADSPAIHDAAARLAAHGVRAEGVQADLSTYDGVENLWNAIQEFGRPLDALALNAGVGVHGAFVGTSLSDEIRMISLNVISVVHLAKRALPSMVARGRGRLMIVSSIAATMPATFTAVYGGTKAFDLNFAEALREELRDTGVTVTAVQPGPTDTRFFARAHMQGTKVAADKKDDAAQVARQAYDAMMAGKDKIYAGSFMTRLKGIASELLGEPLKARQHRKLAEPGSAKAKA